MFLHLSIIQFTGGVGFPACITGRMTSGGEEGQPPRGSPFRGVCIQGGWADSPHGILWDTSGRYASYWNALLFNFSIGDSQIRFIYWIRSFSQIFSGSSFFAHSTTSYEPRCIATIHIYETMFLRNLRSLFWLVCHSN